MAKVPNERVVQKIEQNSGSSAITAGVWHELIYGIERLPSGRRKEALTTYLKEVVGPTFPVLPYDEAAAAWHARERVRLATRGKQAPFADGLIAAVAVTNDLVLVTANRRDFQSFDELEIQDWTRSPPEPRGRRS